MACVAQLERLRGDRELAAIRDFATADVADPVLGGLRLLLGRNQRLPSERGPAPRQGRLPADGSRSELALSPWLLLGCKRGRQGGGCPEGVQEGVALGRTRLPDLSRRYLSVRPRTQASEVRSPLLRQHRHPRFFSDLLLHGREGIQESAPSRGNQPRSPFPWGARPRMRLHLEKSLLDGTWCSPKSSRDVRLTPTLITGNYPLFY